MTEMTTGPRATVTLPSDDALLISREFAAAPHLVYHAWTTPELVAKWWHGNRGEIASIDIDLRVGGAWRYMMTATGGFEVAFHGEYREIVRDERVVTTEIYEGAPDAVALTTTTFTDLGDRTLVEILVRHGSKQARDMHLESGMEDGLQDALALVDELLVSLQ
jgi:uncharacterized protein YndB with AHSA1/START domain